MPFDRNPAWATDAPARAPFSQILHLPHMGHEQREVLVIAPEGVHLIERGVDVQRFLNIHHSPAVEAGHCTEETLLPSGAHQHAGPDGSKHTAPGSPTDQPVQRY